MATVSSKTDMLSDVDDLLSAALAADEVGRLQDVEVVREGALGEIEGLRELARRSWEPLEGSSGSCAGWDRRWP